MAHFTRRHYERIAKILHNSETKEEIKTGLEELFAQDNPRFDRDRFDKAVEHGIVTRSKKKLDKML